LEGSRRRLEHVGWLVVRLGLLFAECDSLLELLVVTDRPELGFLFFLVRKPKTEKDGEVRYSGLSYLASLSLLILWSDVSRLVAPRAFSFRLVPLKRRSIRWTGAVRSFLLPSRRGRSLVCVFFLCRLLSFLLPWLLLSVVFVYVYMSACESSNNAASQQ